VRVVLDTNVLLSGLATHGLSESVLSLAFRDHQVVASEYILDEVQRHLAGKFQVAPEKVERALTLLRSQVEIVEPSPVPRDACDDQDDLPILGTAIAGRAECIVTGDQDLLKLAHYQDVPLLSPRAFYERFRSDA
jgi:putative PIN family toxin of toxin-antitoxin system